MKLRKKQKQVQESEYLINKKNLIIRDHLAVNRTALANERTFLAYVRTSIALVAGGFGLIKFIKDLTYNLLGWFLIGLGLIVLIIGITRFLKFNKSIKSFGCAKIYNVIETKEEPEKEVNKEK